MHEIIARIAENVADRLAGPLKFRFLLQPTVACALAVVSGLKDARAGNPPYFWAIATRPEHRAFLIRDGWKSIGRVALIALAIDLVYQLFVIHSFLPLEAILIAFLLAIAPYVLLRGPVTRLASKRISPADGEPSNHSE